MARPLSVFGSSKDTPEPRVDGDVPDDVPSFASNRWSQNDLRIAAARVERDQLNTLGVIMGCDAAVFTAAKIRRFIEIDPQYRFARRIRKSHGPLRSSLRFLFEQDFIRKRSIGNRILYEVNNWKTLEDYYHELLWRLGLYQRII